jgi:serine/threonine-protein kinase
MAGVIFYGDGVAMANHDKLIRAFAVTSVIGPTALGFAPTAGAAPPSRADTATLMTLLSKGYSPSNCAAAAEVPTGAIAVVDCKQNPLDGGPAAARYLLFSNSDDLSGRFTATIGDDATFPCVAGEPAPQSWHYKSNPDATVGLVSCGTYNGSPELVWTDSDKLVVASAQGPDINAMYQWWLASG